MARRACPDHILQAADREKTGLIRPDRGQIRMGLHGAHEAGVGRVGRDETAGLIDEAGVVGPPVIRRRCVAVGLHKRDARPAQTMEIVQIT